MLKVGFARELITPELGLPLVGYFKPRPNIGVYDDLFVKVLIWDDGVKRAGIVSYDLCAVSEEMLREARAALAKQRIPGGANLMFCATHTHTGPYSMNMLGNKYDPSYMARLIDRTAAAVRRATADLAPAEMACAKTEHNPFAFNRRYFMANGKVATNPGKLNPDIVRPEGVVDREIGVVQISKNGRAVAIIANIVNHGDTIGGDLVSADWPGRMERAIQEQLGYDIPVMTLIGASGNINHFDVSSRRNQICYREACRIGRGYAKIILGLLPKLKVWHGASFKLRKTIFKQYGRRCSADEIRRARALLASAPDAAPDRPLTSEDIIRGSDAIRRCFAAHLLAYYEQGGAKARPFELFVFDFGPDLAIASMPGEPFTEIGLGLKKYAARRLTMVVSHANGKAGYLPLKGCYARGGYEVLPVLGGGAAPGTAEKLLKQLCKMCGK